MSVEQVNLGKILRHKEDPETGLPLEHEVPIEVDQIETRASGQKDCAALLGMLKEEGRKQFQQSQNRREKEGVAVLSDANGRPFEVFQGDAPMYEARGFGQKPLRATFRMSGFSGLLKQSIQRQRIKYRGSGREIETWYRDGRHEIVLAP